MTDHPTPPRADDQQEREALARCPFCGSDNVQPGMAMGEYWIVCDSCDAATGMHGSEEAARAAWNRRVAPEPVREEIKLDDLAEWLRAFVADRSGYSMCKYQTAEIIETIGKAFIARIDELEEQLESSAQPEPQQQGGEGKLREVLTTLVAEIRRGPAAMVIDDNVLTSAEYALATPAPDAQPVILGPSWMCQRCGANMSLEEAHGITHACATPATAAPAVTDDAVHAAYTSFVQTASQSDPGCPAWARVQIALRAAALAAAGKGR